MYQVNDISIDRPFQNSTTFTVSRSPFLSIGLIVLYAFMMAGQV
jgi:hypothetical protein